MITKQWLTSGEWGCPLDNNPKHGAYIINLDKYSDIATHWIFGYIQNNDGTYFGSFGVEYIP